MNKAEQEISRLVVRQWRSAAPELERVHSEELRAYEYDGSIVDAMLEFGLRHAQPREESGLVEMQRYFMKAVGSLDAVCQTACRMAEPPSGYSVKPVPSHVEELGHEPLHGRKQADLQGICDETE